MEWGTPVEWGKFLLFCVPQSVKTKETNPTRPGSPTPCKQALRKKINGWVQEPACGWEGNQKLDRAGVEREANRD